VEVITKFESMTETMQEILKYTLPSLLVFIAVYFVMRSYLSNLAERKRLQVHRENSKSLMPIQLQAYERLALLLERISPNNLLVRENKGGMSVSQLQYELISAVRSEFDHNISQQIYVTPKTWNTVLTVKDEVIKVINLVSASLPNDATGKDLAKAILQFYINSSKPFPNQVGIDILKLEVRKLMDGRSV